MKKYSYIYIIWALAFIIFPLILIFIYSLNRFENMNFNDYVISLDNYKRFLNPLYIKILLVSFGIALLSTIVCLLIGYPLAYIISKMPSKKAGIVIFLFIIPMWINFLLRTYAWLAILGTNGFINKFLASIGLGPINIIYNMNAILIGMVYDYLPFMVLPIYTNLIKIDHSLIEAAKDLGANQFKTFIKVIFPLSLPGVYTGLLMVFIPALSSFVIPNLLGGNKFYLIGNLIEQQFTFTGNWSFGSAVSVILILLVVGFSRLTRLFQSKNVKNEVIK